MTAERLVNWLENSQRKVVLFFDYSAESYASMCKLQETPLMPRLEVWCLVNKGDVDWDYIGKVQTLRKHNVCLFSAIGEDTTDEEAIQDFIKKNKEFVSEFVSGNPNHKWENTELILSEEEIANIPEKWHEEYKSCKG